jgi:protein associated with RNAse G/E
VIRTIANSDGTVVTATPAIVIEDGAKLLAVFIPAGTVAKSNWVVPAAQRVAAVDSMPRSGLRPHHAVVVPEQVRRYLAGEWFAVGLSVDGEGRLTSWYGNLEAPFVRTPIGIDTRDFTLDVLAYPDGTWRWKDEAEFARRHDVGLDSAAHQHRVRSAGKEFVRRFEQRLWPFDAGWERWRPPSGWAAGPLTPDWAVDFGTDELLARPG